MRLVQVAKALGMTGQQLRKELTEVDFGVKPTDREIPDNLAMGVLRFVARKHNLDIDIASIMGVADDEGEVPAERDGMSEERSEEESQEPKQASGPVKVLRKLSLEDVSKEAIAQQEKKLMKKQDREEIKREERVQPARKKAIPKEQQEQIKKKEGKVILPAVITVKEFAEKTGIQVPKVVQALMSSGVMATVNQPIDFDTAAIIAGELGVLVEKEHEQAKAEDLFTRNLDELLRDEAENLTTRPPIVVVMGHVDHGKTSILDAIRETDVVAGESGGITQHIGAYQVTHDGRAITFLDTPGHEAFTSMRARGAKITDVAILVVSGEEGVKATTIEAINHAKDAGVPIIVAINKMDKPNANPETVKGELAGHGLQAEDWGGDTPMVLCSALTKQGIPELLSTVLLVSDMHEPKANAKRPAVATVIESHLDQAHGALATVIVNAGTLSIGDAFVCGEASGKVRAMMDAHGVRKDTVGPSAAVRISGFGDVPQVGDILQVVGSEREARDLAEQLHEHASDNQKRSFADLVSRLHEGKIKQLKIVLKADTQGSLEAIRASLEKQSTEEVGVKVIHSAIGAVTETDVMMAAASDGLVIAFHADVPPSVGRTAEREGVKVREYDIIYKLLEDISALLLGLLEPDETERILGHLEIKGVFLTKKNEQIIGGRVTDGIAKRVPFRLKRGEEVVGQGRIMSLRRVDKDIKEAKEGSECGMRVDSSVPVEEGDVLELYIQEFKKAEN